MARILIVLALTTLAVSPSAHAQGMTPMAAQEPTTLETKAEQGDTGAQVKLAEKYFRNDDEDDATRSLRRSRSRPSTRGER